MENRQSLTRFAWLSIATALVTIGLKLGAYLLTGSVGLLSDALEAAVNLAAAIIALAVLRVAARPPDEEHPYGHSKAEFFASGAEGGLILAAAVSIIIAAGRRLLYPEPLEELGLGLTISVVASLLNLGTAQVLLRAGRRYNSITLEADARHLMTDVWTSVGVLVGIGAVMLTGWQPLDPLVALGVAVNIILVGRQFGETFHFGLDGYCFAGSGPGSYPANFGTVSPGRHRISCFAHEQRGGSPFCLAACAGSRPLDAAAGT
jgi:cation diffusion facilitator family transporter